MPKIRVRPAHAALAMILSVSAVSAIELHVPQQFPTIQIAIDSAPPKATIVVAPGTYRENLLIQKPLKLVSAEGATQTVIDGRRAGAVIVARGTGKEAIAISGFTLTNGFSSLYSQIGYAPGNAGGIYLESVMATVTENVIRDNVGCLGGGISTLEAAVTIEGNQILNNVLDPGCMSSDGGGIFLRADGVRPSVIEDNLIAGHRIGGRGAGIAIQGMRDVTIRGNIIRDNHATGTGASYGGGILINIASAEISHNVLTGNSSHTGGGAAAIFAIDQSNKVSLANNVIQANESASSGSALLLAPNTQKSIKMAGNVIEGSTEVALIQCDTGFEYSITSSNVLRNSAGPLLNGYCKTKQK